MPIKICGKTRVNVDERETLIQAFTVQQHHRFAAIESLEQRRLLATNPFGDVTTVPGGGAANGFSDRASAVSGNGSYIIASLKVVSPDKNPKMQLSASRYTKNGKIISTTVLDSFATTIARSSEVSASMDANGNAVIAYSDDFEPFNVNPPSTSGSIKVIRVSSAGVVSKSELVADGRVAHVSVSMGDAGDYYVAWIKHWISSDPTESIQVRAFNADSSPRGPRIVAVSQTGKVSGTNSFSGTFHGAVEIKSRADGSSAVFVAQGGDKDNQDTVGQVTPNKALGATPFGGSPEASSTPAITILKDGSFEVAYATGAAGTDFNALIQHFKASGKPQGDVITLSGALNPDNIEPPRLSSTPSGGFLAVFSQTLKRVQSVYAQEFAANGRSIDKSPVLLQTIDLHKSIVNVYDVGTDSMGQSLVNIDTNLAFNSIGQYIRLTSSIAAIDKSVLYAFGTGGSDQMMLRDNGASVTMSRDGSSISFASKDVLAAVLSGFGRHDLIENDTSIPSTLRGGAGNDTLKGGTGMDHFDGGSGNDSLFAKDGIAESVFGGAGTDQAVTKDPGDVLDGVEEPA